MKKFKVFGMLLALIIGLLAVLLRSSKELVFESQESKTINGEAVFNKIKWFQFKDKDIWMMNQSHHGIIAKNVDWDRLAIVIDKTKSPKTARFYQLEAGALAWKNSFVSKPFKVSCYMCHSNGPRAIRPHLESTLAPIDLKTRLKIAYWNFRIKLYGRVVESSSHGEQDMYLKTPFRLRGSNLNEELKVPTCLKCHNENGFFARNSLRRQHIPTIEFMTRAGHMPPYGFQLTDEEKKELKRFLKGF